MTPAETLARLRVVIDADAVTLARDVDRLGDAHLRAVARATQHAPGVVVPAGALPSLSPRAEARTP